MSKSCIGIDLGGTSIKFAAVDGDFRPGPVLQLATPVEEGPPGVSAQMVAGVRQLMESQNLSAGDVLGIGIGAPGPLNLTDGIVVAMPNIPGMEDVPIRDLVSGGTGLPAALENDANAAAYGEYMCGAGVDTKNMVLLTLGTGIGGGLVLGGKIYHGTNTAAGEIGHSIVVPGGETCSCGQLGCLERYSSAAFMAKYATDLVEQDGRTGALADRLAEAGEITAKDIQQAAAAGDALADEVWSRGMYHLAVGCVNICRWLDPDKIVLAGGMTKAGEGLMKPLMEHFRRVHWSLTEPLTTIEIAKLGSDAGVIGAAGVAWDAFGRETRGFAKEPEG